MEMRTSMTRVATRIDRSEEARDLYRVPPRRQRVIGTISRMTSCRRRGRGMRGYGVQVGEGGKGIDEFLYDMI